jgi:hypothetical protein
MAVHAQVANAPATGFLEWPQGGKVAREATRARGVLRGWATTTAGAYTRPLFSST